MEIRQVVMKSSRRNWMFLAAGAVLFLAGVVYDGLISELPHGNPPPALMDYYNRHHRIATAMSGVGGVLLLLSLLGFAVDWIGRQTACKR